MLTKNRKYHHNQFLMDYIQADVGDLPFKPQFFNTIINFASFAHFNSKERAIEEFWRILSPGGICVILHLMGCNKLNMMHDRVGNAVKNDRLPPINKLASRLEYKKFRILHKEDKDHIYLLIAQKQK
jgi:ubiquinone/menaquinone biosynthesis C-methylase UbiE